jgi:hypothetical protein
LVIELDIVTAGGLSFAAVEDLLLGEGGLEFLVHLVDGAGLGLELILSLPLFELDIFLVGLDGLLE